VTAVAVIALRETKGSSLHDLDAADLEDMAVRRVSAKA